GADRKNTASGQLEFWADSEPGGGMGHAGMDQVSSGGLRSGNEVFGVGVVGDAGAGDWRSLGTSLREDREEAAGGANVFDDFEFAGAKWRSKVKTTCASESNFLGATRRERQLSCRWWRR